MNVVVGFHRHVVVENMRDVGNVNTTCGDIGCHKGLDVAIAEALDDALACALLLVTVKGVDAEAVFHQHVVYFISTALGAGEHQKALGVLFRDQVLQKCELVVAVHKQKLVINVFGHFVVIGCLNGQWIFKGTVGQVTHAAAHGGREQNGLACIRHFCRDGFYIVHKAHVQHAVGFVQHEKLNVGHVNRATLHMVHQTTGGGDQNINAALQMCELVTV